MFNVLIVEDDKKLNNLIRTTLVKNGYNVYTAENGNEGIDVFDNNYVDLVVSDIMMPGLDGHSVCRLLRRKSDVPIIFLTALSAEEDKLYGYELGADDYITKPFSLSLLYAKTSALIRRSRGSMAGEGSIRVGALLIEPELRRVFADGKEITLTPKEYELLLCLARNKNIVMSREPLLVKCWGYDYEGDSRAVDTQIKRLREKLGSYAECIKTVIKVGYRLEA